MPPSVPDFFITQPPTSVSAFDGPNNHTSTHARTRVWILHWHNSKLNRNHNRVDWLYCVYDGQNAIVIVFCLALAFRVRLCGGKRHACLNGTSLNVGLRAKCFVLLCIGSHGLIDYIYFICALYYRPYIIFVFFCLTLKRSSKVLSMHHYSLIRIILNVLVSMQHRFAIYNLMVIVVVWVFGRLPYNRLVFRSIYVFHLQYISVQWHFYGSYTSGIITQLVLNITPAQYCSVLRMHQQTVTLIAEGIMYV